MTDVSLDDPGVLLRAEAHQGGLAALRERGWDAETAPAALRTLEDISLAAMADVVLGGGALPDDGSVRTAEQIVAAIGVVPRHDWLLRRWLVALTDTGWIRREGGGFQAGGRQVGTVQPGDEFETAYAALGFPPRMARFHRAALFQLRSLLRDEAPVQQLLFQDGDVLAALAAYQDNVFTEYLNSAAAVLVRGAVSTRRPRPSVVEIGGGAGLSTRAALRALDGCDFSYRFTDLSRLFTVAAKERFGAYKDVSYGLLDLNEDFTAQGAAAGGADVILAGNVLHNATHIGESLDRIHQLLAPGSWLVFSESTRENHAILTSMQFLLSAAPGNVRAGFGDRRAASGQMFLTESEWHEELSAAGFAPWLGLPDGAGSLAVSGQHLFAASALPGAGRIR